MEKPTGVIQKIIESLQQVNALDVYSPIEKDIILHNLRAAYMIFLNTPADECCWDNRVDELFSASILHPTADQREKEESCSERLTGSVENREWIDEEQNYNGESDIQECQFNEEQTDDDLSNEEVFENNAPPCEVVDEAETGEDIVEELHDEVEDSEGEKLHDEVIDSVENENKEGIEVITPSIESASKIFVHPIEEEPDLELQDDLLEFIPDAKPQSTLLFDELSIPKPEKKSLNDLLTEKKDDNSLGARLQQSFIPDLTKAIAINEKFSFIRELFHNSGVDFSMAIQKLNECESIDAAFLLLEEYKHQYLWDTTSPSYLSLCDLVRRRFLS